MFAKVTENECINDRHPFVKSDNLINSAQYLANGPSQSFFKRHFRTAQANWGRTRCRRRRVRGRED